MSTQAHIDFLKSNRYSAEAFGGGEDGEDAAHAALKSHEATLTVGTRVRVYRGAMTGVEGTIVEGRGPGGTFMVSVPAEYTIHGQPRGFESRNLELLDLVSRPV